MKRTIYGFGLSIRQLLAISSCFFVSMTDIKIGALQVAEFVTLLLLALYISSEFIRIKIQKFVLQDWLMMLFISTVAISSIYALNTEVFAIPSDAGSILKSPGWISFSRIIQMLALFVCYKLIIAECKKNSSMLDICANVYIYSGFVASLYGLFSYFFLVTIGFDMGGAYGEYGYRLRAFYVEGGPYGLFSGSVLLLILARWNSGSIPSARQKFIFFCVALSFLLAQSKSAFFALFLALSMSFLLRNPTYLIRNFKIFLLVTGVISITAIYSGAGDVFNRLMSDRQSLIESPDLFVGDHNYAMGRIAAGIIVPQMISENPVLGIGLGNYSLLRDADKYNLFLPRVDMWDLHGLGLLGLTAEVGVLGILFLSAFFLLRYIRELKSGGSVFFLAISAYPLAALLFGVQPTFSYPWILLALSESFAKSSVTNFLK